MDFLFARNIGSKYKNFNFIIKKYKNNIKFRKVNNKKNESKKIQIIIWKFN